MTPALLHRLIVAVSDEVIAHADELTALDQAVGDGDHGVNMKRGFEAVRADAATDGGEATAGSAEGDRHATRYESRRRLWPPLRHAFPCAEQGDRFGRLESPNGLRRRRRSGQSPRKVASGPEDHAGCSDARAGRPCRRRAGPSSPAADRRRQAPPRRRSRCWRRAAGPRSWASARSAIWTLAHGRLR